MQSIWWISTSRDQSSNKLIIFLKSALDSRSLVTSGQNLESCDINFDSRKLRDLRIELRELGCEVLSTYFWAVLYYLLTRCAGPDVHTKCIKNKNILQFCSQVRPNTKIHRLGFSAKQDKQPFLFLFCCLKAFAHYRGMCMWVLTGDINGYCCFLENWIVFFKSFSAVNFRESWLVEIQIFLFGFF